MRDCFSKGTLESRKNLPASEAAGSSGARSRDDDRRITRITRDFNDDLRAVWHTATHRYTEGA